LLADCHIKKSEWLKASIAINDAIRLEYKDLELHFTSAVIYYNLSFNKIQNKYADSQSEFELYIRNSDNENKIRECYIYLGKIHELNDRKNESISAYKKALSKINDKKLKFKIERKIKSLQTSLKWTSR